MSARFVSEPVDPLPGSSDARAMVRGEPGLPPGFVWRGREYRIVSRLEAGKETSEDRGDVYVRRHTFRLGMEDGSTWEIYFLRQPPRGASRRARSRRWFLKSVEDPQPD